MRLDGNVGEDSNLKFNFSDCSGASSSRSSELPSTSGVQPRAVRTGGPPAACPAPAGLPNSVPSEGGRDLVDLNIGDNFIVRVAKLKS